MFFKNTFTSPDTTIIHYTPTEPSNVLRYTLVTKYETKTSEEGEEIKEVKDVFLVLEHPIVAEQERTVPLKVMKKVKQTKDVEYFYVEEVVKLTQPLTSEIRDNLDAKIEWLEANSI